MAPTLASLSFFFDFNILPASNLRSRNVDVAPANSLEGFSCKLHTQK